MTPVIRAIFLLLFMLASLGAMCQKKQAVAILDAGTGNGEGKSVLFSAEHVLIQSGLPYIITQNVEEACSYSMVLGSGNIEQNTFSTAQRNSLKNYLSEAGILFFTNVKDSVLFDAFGVKKGTYYTRRYKFITDHSSSDPLFDGFNEPEEREIKLGDSSYTSIIGTRCHPLNGAKRLAHCENDSSIFSVNQYGKGYAYALGISWEDIILRNQVTKGFKPGRSFSNIFEPGTDIFMMFLRNIFYKHMGFACWKHTSPQNSKASLIITHDVDATTGIEKMNDFAGYENANGIKASYFITTHYMHDSLARDFYTGYVSNMIRLFEKGHVVGSHSVGHFPDFDNSSYIPEGNAGNTRDSYRPFFNGTTTSGATVFGELEVSKSLLEAEVGASVKAFRAGYLAFNKRIINVLQQAGYDFNSTHSANNVCTNYPFRSHTDLSMEGTLTGIYEIPNTISDVVNGTRIVEENIMPLVERWKAVIRKNSENGAPTVLLIHPNRIFKLNGEQEVILSLDKRTQILPLEEYGNFWKKREKLNYAVRFEGGKLNVTFSEMPDSSLSFYAKNGQNQPDAEFRLTDGTLITMNKTNASGTDVIYHLGWFTADYTRFLFEENKPFFLSEAWPNPAENELHFRLETMEPLPAKLEIINTLGQVVSTPFSGTIDIGNSVYSLKTNELGSGLYFARWTLNTTVTVKRILIP